MHKSDGLLSLQKSAAALQCCRPARWQLCYSSLPSVPSLPSLPGRPALNSHQTINSSNNVLMFLKTMLAMLTLCGSDHQCGHLHRLRLTYYCQLRQTTSGTHLSSLNTINEKTSWMSEACVLEPECCVVHLTEHTAPAGGERTAPGDPATAVSTGGPDRPGF